MLKAPWRAISRPVVLIGLAWQPHRRLSHQPALTERAGKPLPGLRLQADSDIEIAEAGLAKALSKMKPRAEGTARAG
jgi:hypothetical protein